MMKESFVATKNKGASLGFQYKTLTPLLKVLFNVEQRSYACIQMSSKIFIIYTIEIRVIHKINWNINSKMTKFLFSLFLMTKTACEQHLVLMVIENHQKNSAQ